MKKFIGVQEIAELFLNENNASKIQEQKHEQVHRRFRSGSAKIFDWNDGSDDPELGKRIHKRSHVVI